MRVLERNKNKRKKLKREAVVRSDEEESAHWGKVWTIKYREGKGDSLEGISEETGECGQRGQELGKDRIIGNENRGAEFGVLG